MAKQRRSPFSAVFYTDKALKSLGLGQPNSDGHALGSVNAFHKVCYDASPYCVPNELICAEIGRFLTLPIPPCGVTNADALGAQPIFSSLDFKDERLITAEPDQCVLQFLDLSTGICLFDVLIANPDRLPRNLKTDRSIEPRELRVYDHEQALFGSEGVARLERVFGSFGVSWPEGDGEHCLMPFLEDGRYYDKWLDWISRIPKWFIEHTCRRMVGYGLTKAEADSAAQFLEYRKARLDDIVRANQQWFPPSFFDPQPESLF